jgi:hypothetical protein
MKKNTNSCQTRIGTFAAIVFLLVFTQTATAKSILEYQTLLQERLLYIAVSLVFFFIFHHTVCSRISYDGAKTGEGGEEKQ